MARNIKAREDFFSNYVNVLFMLLSLVQGLAFQELAQKARFIVPYGIDNGLNFVPALYCLFMLMIQMRVLQTYITVGIDYGPTYVNFYDILVLFVAGILQAFILGHMNDPSSPFFDKSSDVINVRNFWMATSWLAAIAAIIYGTNIKKVGRERDRFASESDVLDEKNLQTINCALMVFLFLFGAICILTIRSTSDKSIWAYAAPIVGCLVMGFTTAKSLASTFGIKAYRKTDPTPIGFYTLSPSDLILRSDLSPKSATHEHIDSIVTMLCEQRRSELASLFGVCESRVEELLGVLMRPESHHFFSINNWHVAVYSGNEVASRGQVCGAILFETKSATEAALARKPHVSRFRIARYNVLKHTSTEIMPPTWEATKDLVTRLGVDGIKYLQSNLKEYDFGSTTRENDCCVRFACAVEEKYQAAAYDTIIESVDSPPLRLAAHIFEDEELLAGILQSRGMQRAPDNVGVLSSSKLRFISLETKL